MGVTNDVGNLPDQIQLKIDSEICLALSEKMVQPNVQRIMFENQGRANFMLGISIRLENAGMLKCLKQLELS